MGGKRGKKWLKSTKTVPKNRENCLNKWGKIKINGGKSKEKIDKMAKN